MLVLSPYDIGKALKETEAARKLAQCIQLNLHIQSGLLTKEKRLMLLVLI